MIFKEIIELCIIDLWTMDYALTMDYVIWTVDYGLLIMDYGLWIMDYGLCHMEYGLWTMDYGVWTMDYGVCIMYCGLCTMGERYLNKTHSILKNVMTIAPEVHLTCRLVHSAFDREVWGGARPA